MLAASLLSISVLAADFAYACDQSQVSRRIFATNSVFSFPPGKAFFANRRCEWRKRIRIPNDCNANLIAIDGEGIRPEYIDILREADNEERLSRTTQSLPNGHWTFEQNNFICNNNTCKDSFYRINTSQEVPNFICWQWITVTLELF
jgi:hypothetical protein